MLADLGRREPPADERPTAVVAFPVASRGGEPRDDGVDVSASGDAWLQKLSRRAFDSADLGCSRSGESALLRSGEPGSALLGRMSDLRADAAAAGTRVGGDGFRATANTCGAAAG